MTCLDYPRRRGGRNSHTGNLSGKVWPAVGIAGMLRPGGRPSAAHQRGPAVIAFNCPKCWQALEFPDDASGRVVRCQWCRAKLRLPGELPPTEDEPPPERPRRKKRRRPRPVEEEPAEAGETPEWVAPTCLLALGLVLAVGGMAVTLGREGFALGFMFVGLRLVLTVPLSIAALFIAAPLLGISFGPFGLAVLKLAAINVLTLGIALTAILGGTPPFLAYTAVAPVGWMLFNWLFELEVTETMIVLTLIWLIQNMAGLMVTIARLRHLVG